MNNESMLNCCEEAFSVQNGWKLIKDSIGHAILDTACTSTVTGVEWMNIYLDSLTPEDRLRVKEYDSESNFRFGDGVTYKSLKKVKFPVRIGGEEEYITTDVVDCFIPLLLSKKSMKKGRMNLNFVNDTVWIKGRKIKLDCTNTGHYRLPLQDLRKIRKKKEEIEEVMITLGKDGNEKKKYIKKLHHQFGHPSARRLNLLLKDAEIEDTECHSLVEEISSKCETCIKFKKTPSRPIVSMNMAKEVNDIVALDLKVYKQSDIYFLHMIDLATRFSRSSIIRSKDPNEVVESIIVTWLGSGLGAPMKFLCDNGAEFANNTFLDLCENMNIEVMHTSAYSPFSNGVCERNHAVIDDMVYKIMAEQPELKLEIALAWAVNAKNSLQMVGGFSPHQLVYGCNPRLPGVLNDELPALEGTTSSEVIARHHNARHSARKAFISAEASEKIRRALKANIKQSNKQFTDGDKVYFKRPDKKEWNGPATVIGKDGKTVILKYGAHIVRCHEIHVQEIPYSFKNDKEKGKEDHLKVVENNFLEKECQEDDEEISAQIHDGKDNVDQHKVQKALATHTIPEIGQKVKFWKKDNEEGEVGTILSRGGKVGGKYTNWRNIVDDEGKIMALDWLQVERWEPLDNEKEMDEENSVSSQETPNVSKDKSIVDEALMASKLDLEKEVELKNAKIVEL